MTNANSLCVGGTLGFSCSHAYAYNNKLESPFPEVLKGVDAAIWESFKALGVDVQVSPIVQMDEDVHRSYHRVREDRLKPSKWVVGKKLGLHVNRGCETDSDAAFRRLYENWGSSRDIVWVSKPKKADDVQIVYTAVSFTRTD